MRAGLRASRSQDRERAAGTMHGRAKLSDLGVAARIGERDSVPPGSPFSASPQQHAGEPPAIADDVYGFGALAYELLSGYPPHYPDAAAARSGGAASGTIPARVPVPAALDATRARLSVARSPDERPRDMNERARGARAAADTRRTRLHQPRPSRARRCARRRMHRRRSSHAGTERRGVETERTRTDRAFGAASWAPRLRCCCWARRPGVLRPAAAGTAAADRGGTRHRRRQAAARGHPSRRSRAEGARSAEATRRGKTRVRGAAARDRGNGSTSSSRGRRRTGAARRSNAPARDLRLPQTSVSRTRDYESALAELKRVVPDLTATESGRGGVLRTALRPGNAALEQGTAAEAERQFALALKLQPDHPQAKRGLERAHRPRRGSPPARRRRTPRGRGQVR